MILYINAHMRELFERRGLKHTKKMHLYVHKADFGKINWVWGQQSDSFILYGSISAGWKKNVYLYSAVS